MNTSSSNRLLSVVAFIIGILVIIGIILYVNNRTRQNNSSGFAPATSISPQNITNTPSPTTSVTPIVTQTPTVTPTATPTATPIQIQIQLTTPTTTPLSSPSPT